MAGYYYTSASSTTDSTWGLWAGNNVDYSNSTTDSTATWNSWNTSVYTYTGAASTSAVWVRWTSGDGYYRAITQPYVMPQPTEEELRRQREAAELARQREIQRKQETEAAEAKANELMRELVGEEQWKIYERTGRLLVKGQHYDYLIQKNGVTKRLMKDKFVDLCIHLEKKHEMPPTDNVIALALLAKADGYEFDRRANNRGECAPYELPEAACM